MKKKLIFLLVNETIMIIFAYTLLETTKTNIMNSFKFYSELKKVNEIRTAIENNGGLTSFSSKIRKIRPEGCPMKNMMVDELQELSKEELHVAFHLGLIGNANIKGSIVENSKRN